MKINKSNQDIIDIGELNLHDATINTICFDINNKKVVIKITKYDKGLIDLNFTNVFNFTSSSWDIMKTSNKNEIYGWDEK